jgi:hypothetical protein
LLDLNLQVTYRASGELWKIKKELEKTDEDAILTNEQAQNLETAMDSIRKTLVAELLGFEVYIITPKRIDVNKLVSNVESLFAPEVFYWLPEIAQHDLEEAGKCLAFERATASAFHLMRATESVLREFYCHHVKRSRVKPMLWGPMVQSLRRRTKFKGNETYLALFNNLDNIRRSFRNPTQHPDKIYDIQEAQDLWGLSVDVINRMAKDLIEEIPF